MHQPAVTFVRAMFEAGRPAAVMCHGPWTLVEGDLVRDRTLTSWSSVQTDIRNAGGNWVDKEVMVCERGPNVLVTSRKPDDLPAFCAKMVRVFAAAPARSRV
jgi:protease I